MAKPKVVVVDKSPIIVNWVRAALAGDYEVVGVTRAMEAPGTVVREEPALILVEPAMPIVGDEIVRLVRDAVGPRRALLVLFSSQPSVELAERARVLGAAGYIEKSGDAHTFAQRIRALLAPGHRATAVARTPHPPRPPAAGPDAGKALLVAGRDWLAHGTLLPRAGFALDAVASAQGVQRVLRERKPALLVVGPDLHDASAAGLCAAVRADPLLRRISILFVGEPHEQARAAQVREAGANETLLRPLDEMTLFQAVGRLTNIAARRNARLLVRIDLRVEQAGEFCVGFSHNVSASGMLLEADRPLKKERPLTLRFFVPGCDDEIDTEAGVVRVQAMRENGSVVGVRFERIAPEHSEVIDRFVRAQSA